MSSVGIGPWAIYLDHGRDVVENVGQAAVRGMVTSMMYRRRVTNIVDSRGHDVTNAWLHPSARMDRSGTARGKTRLVARVDPRKLHTGRATHYEDARGQKTGLASSSRSRGDYCRICQGPHVYKHGRP